MVIADADAFVTALVNLLENALKYTASDKRISVRASADGAGSSASTSPTTAWVSLQVSISGSSGGSIASITAVARDRRRRPWPQHRRTGRARARGLGGRAECSRCRQHVHTACAVRTPVADGMTHGRLLLIEDEPALARGLSDTLRAQGFDVTIAADGAQGLEAATSGAADLILLDVMLPKVNGYEICRAVRAHGLDVPILMLTAKGRKPTWCLA